MGFFSKNYDTPGKGVSKNEPEKKGFFRFFELYFRNFWLLVSAGLWYILLSIPVVTSGLANVGMAYICRMAARDKHVFLTSDFFGAIKRNWKKALPVGIINLILTAIFAADLYVLYVFWSQDIINKTWGMVVFAASVVFLAGFTFMQYYIYTLMITFDFSIKTLYKNSWLFATLGIKHNLIITGTLAVIFVLAYILLVLNFRIGLTIIIVVGAFIYPSFSAFLIQFNVFPEIKKYIIDPYYKEHPDKDIEKRRDLGLIEYEEESIFEDNGVEED